MTKLSIQTFIVSEEPNREQLEVEIQDKLTYELWGEDATCSCLKPQRSMTSALF